MLNGQVLIDGNVLVNKVNSFTLSYFVLAVSSIDGVWSEWDFWTDGIHNLSTIQVDLELARPDIEVGGSVSFTTTVHPRLI